MTVRPSKQQANVTNTVLQMVGGYALGHGERSLAMRLLLYVHICVSRALYKNTFLPAR